MAEVCKNCGRDTCMVPVGRAHLGMGQLEFKAAVQQQRKDRAECRQHTVDWYARARAAEATLARVKQCADLAIKMGRTVDSDIENNAYGRGMFVVASGVITVLDGKETP